MRTQQDVTEVTVWYRGVTEARLARRMVGDLAAAAARDGHFVQAFDNYADSPDRVNVPCRSYARIGTAPIQEPYLYVNETPAVVIVTEATLSKGCDVLKGMKPPGTLVINTARSPEQMLAVLGDLNTGALKTIATVDGGNGARPRAPYGAGEGAAEARMKDPGPAGALLGATSRATDLVSLEALLAVEVDHDGLRRGFDQVRILANPAYTGVQEQPLAEGFRGRVDLIIKAPAPNGVNAGHISGNYRVQRPIINMDRCTACGICWILCPDAAISIPGASGEKIAINYEYCKGCGVCWTECNVDGAIRAEPELDFWGGMTRIAYGL